MTAEHESLLSKLAYLELVTDRDTLRSIGTEAAETIKSMAEQRRNLEATLVISHSMAARRKTLEAILAIARSNPKTEDWMRVEELACYALDLPPPPRENRL